MIRLKLYSILLVIMCFLVFKVNAQSDSLKLSDISIQQVKARPQADFNSIPVRNDTSYCKITFKVSDLQKLDKVFIKVGTSQSESSNVNEVLILQQRSAEYYLTGSAGEFKIWDKKGYFPFRVVRLNGDPLQITIYGIDKSGGFTKKSILKF